MARVYAVASAKGGVGKSTTTANLASTLAAADYDIAVVDGDIGMANLAGMLGVDVDGPTLHDVLAGDADVADATYPGPHGMSVVPGDVDLGSYSDAEPRRLGRVVGAFADRDFVFVDTGAGLSHETALPLGLVDDVILVSTAERDALLDTDKTRELAERLDGTVAGVVLTRVDGGNPQSDVDTGSLDVPVLGVVPEDESLAAATAAGDPVTRKAADSGAAAGYREVASEVADRPVRPPVSDEADPGDADETATTRADTDTDADATDSGADRGATAATGEGDTSQNDGRGDAPEERAGSRESASDADAPEEYGVEPEERDAGGGAIGEAAAGTPDGDGSSDDEEEDDGGFLSGLFG
ncbi:MAG: P-loop NTPase [Halolamina sp.]